MRSRFILLSIILFVFIPAAPALADNRPGAGYASLQSSPGEEPGIGLRLLDAPAKTQSDPRARSYIVDHLNPGSVIERRIQVRNGTDTTQNLRFYPSAASVKDSAFIGAPGETGNELTTWISVDHPTVALAPGDSANVLVTVDVPRDAPETEQYAVVWAEVQSAGDSAGGVVNAGRVGIRVYLSVGPGNGPATDFTIDTLTPGRNPEGSPELTTTVTNTGGRALDITGSLTLTGGPGGLSAGPNPIDRGTSIAPGASAPVSITLPPELPNGPWTADLTLESGLVSHEATADITFPETGEGTAVSPDQGPGIVWVAAGAAGLVLIVVGFILWRRRRNTAGKHG